jgi:histidinol phosphatase-like enzyme (inositol monophosphatase family)
MEIGEAERAELIAALHQMADAAASYTLPLFRSPELSTSDKGHEGWFDPVTQADRAAEQAIRKVISARYPDDSILGEEFPPTEGSTGRTWVLDPIDGTRAFMSGMPSWGTLIGLDTGNGPILGLIDQPYIGERFVGGFGKASLFHRENERPIATRPCSSLNDAILYSTFPEIGTAAEKAGFASVDARTRLTRYGTDCYGYALLAMGQCDLVIEAGLNAYDIQGPLAVVEAAGGIVTGWKGEPAHHGGRVLAAGDREVHMQALEYLSKVPD